MVTMTAVRTLPVLTRPGLLLAMAYLVLVLVAAVAPSLLTNAEPVRIVGEDRFIAPSAAHPFGTDHLGRDMVARVIHGTSQTLLTAGLAVTIGLLVGTVFGLLAATGGKTADLVIMRAVDVLLAVPAFLIALSLVAAFKPGPIALGLGIGIASIAMFARVVRAEVLAVRSLDFVEASFLSGGRPAWVAFRHVLPNSLGPVLSLAVVDMGFAILAIAGLGFLGFGSPPPTPEWGVIVADGRQYLATAWWLTTIPGIVIVLTVVCLGVCSRELLKRTQV